MIGGLLKSASSVALFAALGLVAVAGVSPAKAADLGGDCCADLEERVAELEATTARKGNRKVSLTISGQVSTMVMAWDAGGKLNGTGGNAGLVGNSRDVYIVDNVMSGGSFFALTGDAKINPNLSAGFNMTVAFDTGGRSHQASQFDDDGQATVPTVSAAAAAGLGGGYDTFMVVTLANWYLDHKQLGRVTVGRINTSTAGISTIDLGGAGVIANANIGYTQRGFSAVGNSGATWANLLGGNAVNGSGLSRANAIQYSTPNVGGFSASASFGENNVWDVALRYAGEFSGFRLAAGIGYVSNQNGLGDVTEDVAGALGCAVNGAAVPPAATIDCTPNQLKGSASILHVASGLYLSGSYVRQDNDIVGRSDTTLWYLNGGITKNWTGLGNTVLYGEYARVDNGLENYSNFGGSVIADAEATVWGLGIVQNIDAAAMELFLAYRNYSADVPGRTVEDFQTVLGGARIKF